MAQTHRVGIDGRRFVYLDARAEYLDADAAEALAAELMALADPTHAAEGKPIVKTTSRPTPDIAMISRILGIVTRSGVTPADLQPEEVHAALLAGA